MMEIGKIQKLKVIKEKDFGIYLSDGDKADAQGVLLPKKQVPAGTKIGDELEVFLYKDSEDRLIATTSRPKVTLGETAGSTTALLAEKYGSDPVYASKCLLTNTLFSLITIPIMTLFI